MKKILLTGVAFAALACGTALAADLPARRMPVKAPEPVAVAYNWSGFYIGAHAGAGFGEKCFTFAGASDGCHDSDGWLGGGQVGFNIQTGQFVFGVEFSGSWADINGSHTAIFNAPAPYNSEINSILMLTGRVGVAFDRVLIYATGGGAWVRDTFGLSNGIVTASVKQNRTGWTVGGGLEWGFTPNWSIAGQYNYIDFGDKVVDFVVLGPPPRVDQQVHLATVRLNYRFGWGGPVVARY